MNFDPTVLGVSGVTVAILLTFIKVLWDRYQAEIDGRHADQAAMLPALQNAATALTAATEELIRSRTLAERERQ